MKFGLYLSTHSRDIWRSQYIKCAYTRPGYCKQLHAK